MYTCKNCGQTYSDPVKFCGKCGGNSFETQQQGGGYQQAADYNASYSNPTPNYSYVSAPAPETASKGPAIVGMIFGIIALIFSLACIVCASEALDTAEYYDSFYYYRYSLSYLREEAYAALGVLSVFVIPSFIIGLVMSFKRSGIKAMSIVGKVTSFVALGFWIISFIMIASI